MDRIDEEIRALETGWAAEAEAQKLREADAQREHLEAVRDRLRSGKWKPYGHRCFACLRAILTMDPSLVCEDGKRNGVQWWRRN